MYSFDNSDSLQCVECGDPSGLSQLCGTTRCLNPPNQEGLFLDYYSDRNILVPGMLVWATRGNSCELGRLITPSKQFGNWIIRFLRDGKQYSRKESAFWEYNDENGNSFVPITLESSYEPEIGDTVVYVVDGNAYQGILAKKLLVHWVLNPINRPDHTLPKMLSKNLIYQIHYSSHPPDVFYPGKQVTAYHSGEWQLGIVTRQSQIKDHWAVRFPDGKLVATSEKMMLDISESDNSDDYEETHKIIPED